MPSLRDAGKEKKRYYKVIKSKTRTSAIVANRNIAVKYLPMKWTRPKVKGSKLLVFDDLSTAVHWKKEMEWFKYAPMGSLEVVPCDVLHPTTIDFKLRISRRENLASKDVSTFWEGIKKIRKSRSEAARKYKKRNRKLTRVWDYTHREQSLKKFSEEVYPDVESGVPPNAVAVSAVKCLR